MFRHKEKPLGRILQSRGTEKVLIKKEGGRGGVDKFTVKTIFDQKAQEKWERNRVTKTR